MTLRRGDRASRCAQWPTVAVLIRYDWIRSRRLAAEILRHRGATACALAILAVVLALLATMLAAPAAQMGRYRASGLLIGVFAWAVLAPRLRFVGQLIDGPLGAVALQPRVRECWIGLRALAAALVVTLAAMAVATPFDLGVWRVQGPALATSTLYATLIAGLMAATAPWRPQLRLSVRPGIRTGRTAAASPPGGALVLLHAVLRERVGGAPRVFLLCVLVCVALAAIQFTAARQSGLALTVGLGALALCGLVANRSDARLVRFVGQQPFHLRAVVLRLLAPGLLATCACALALGVGVAQPMWWPAAGVVISAVLLFALNEQLHLLSRGATARLAAQIDLSIAVVLGLAFAPLAAAWIGWRILMLWRRAGHERWRLR